MWLPSASAGQATDDARLTKVGRVSHPPVGEMSGIVKSQRYDNVWWVHNDRGNQPRLFAIDSTGSVHMRSYLADEYAVGAEADTSQAPAWPGLRLAAAANVDYEDIAIGDNTLYVGDIGNNFNARRDLGIYVVPEPHFEAQRTRPNAYIRIAYPNQDSYPAEEFHFDAEALFVADGTLHVLTKRWTREEGEIVGLESGSTLYRLDTEHPHRVNALTRVDHNGSVPAPTAAAVSPSGDRLAILSYGAIWVFPRPTDGTHWLSTEPQQFEVSGERLKQSEAVSWDGPDTLRITNEQRDIFQFSLDG